MGEETFYDKMRRKGWHNVYEEKPPAPGKYQVYRRNDRTGYAEYLGKGVWYNGSNGWDIIYWR